MSFTVPLRPVENVDNGESNSQGVALLITNQSGEKVYRWSHDKGFLTVIVVLNDEHLAQDAVQEAFINISNNLEKIIGTDCNKIKALFVIIVRNVSIDIYRLRRKQYSVSIEEIEEDLPESGPSVEEILMNNETFTRVAEKIKELHPSYADILSLNNLCRSCAKSHTK